MVKTADILKCKHPNSRKSKALLKQINKSNVKQKIKFGSNIKLNILGEKVLWFKNHFNNNKPCLTPEETEELILRYLSRFEEELQEIKLKHSIGNRKNRQHANREDIINMSINREKEEFETCGIEIPNLLCPKQCAILMDWNGELRFLQNFKLKRISKKYLNSLKG